MTKPTNPKKPAVPSKSTGLTTEKTTKAAPKAIAKASEKPSVPATSTPEVKTASNTANKSASKAPTKSATKSVTKSISKAAVTEFTPPAKSAAKSAVVSNGLVPKASSKSGTGSPAPKSGAVAEAKAKKAKLVRDSFTMPASEYQILNDMKKAALQAGFVIKKSELLRIGVALIQKTDVEKIRTMLDALTPLKAGRPKTEK